MRLGRVEWGRVAFGRVALFVSAGLVSSGRSGFVVGVFSPLIELVWFSDFFFSIRLLLLG